MSHNLFPVTLSPTAVQWLIVIWLAALGGTIGSFLNVVIYRLPRGMSLVAPGSHCPACKHPIRWYDNLPVLGWFILRGRCRDCGVRISARYPAVEAVTLLLFVGLGVAEWFSGGANLPLRPIAMPDGTLWLPLTTSQLTVVYAYHLLLLCTLLAAALIQYDAQRLPLGLMLPAAVVGLLAPMAWHWLHPVPVSVGLDGWIGGLCDGLAGLVAGGVSGLLIWRFTTAEQKRGTLAAIACTGLFLGWQAAVVVAALTTVIYLPLAAAGQLWNPARRIPPAALLMLVALGWIIAWAPLIGRWPLLGYTATLFAE